MGRHGAQYRGPLEIIERAAHDFLFGKEQLIFHVEQTRGVVGALDEQSDARKPIGVVAQHGAIGAAVVNEGHLFHEVEEAREILAGFRAARAFDRLHLEKAAVDRLPHIDGQGRANGARVGARKFDAIADRAGIVRGEGEEFDDIRFVERSVCLREGGRRTGGQ